MTATNDAMWIATNGVTATMIATATAGISRAFLEERSGGDPLFTVTVHFAARLLR